MQLPCPWVNCDHERNTAVKTLKMSGAILLTLSILVLAICSTATVTAGESTEEPAQLRFYIGTYTGGKSQGIYMSQLNPMTGELAAAVLVGETTNPSFLAMHPSGDFLYAVGEISSFEGQKTGAVTAWKIDRDTGQLEFLGEDPSGGPGPCHLVVDATGKTLLVANYSGGSVSSREIFHNGHLGNLASFHQHHGSSVNPRRQQQPHAHSINLDRENRYAIVADLGLDEILVYQLDAVSSELSRNSRFPELKVEPGSGPRHLSFHPTADYAYVINELNSTITALRYEPQPGRLEAIQTVSTLPPDFDGDSYTAEVVVHPSGKFVYGSNRGHDSIAVFRIEPESGQLQSVQIEPTQGKTPRNFAVDPTGNYLLAENQDSDTIVVFRIDPDSGRLTATGHTLEVPKPVCIKFALH